MVLSICAVFHKNITSTLKLLYFLEKLFLLHGWFFYLVVYMVVTMISHSPAMIAPIVVALAVGFLGWAYRALKPPPPKICGSPDGPPITSPRVKLSDGRHLAYRESGVPKEVAKYKIIAVHGYDSPKDLSLPLPQV
jgi:hypothetical protein